ncbi:MAG TPA: TonB-dependent receptor [Bacteroidales bacterium]|nr:TonB-dependent receptor [Bacteroidales bacterium]
MRSLQIIFLLFLQGAALLFAQETGLVQGTVKDENNDPLPGVAVINLTERKGVVTDASGNFRLMVTAGKEVHVALSLIGYEKDTLLVTVKPGESVSIVRQLKQVARQLGEVVVESWYDRAESLKQIDLRSIDHIPLPSGNLESMLTTLGASTRNEMSSQYSVRGGSFDENLIYVNDIEVYRPLSVKAGQQEGLSFINSSLVSSIQFAPGGFDARYGDKMSSVLDIRYKRPAGYAASATVGLLGGSAHLEGASTDNRFTHITGVRYKTNQYLLNTLQTKGDYKPRFFDLQTFLTFDLSDNLEISFLGNAARNYYQVIPQSRQTAFGTYQQALNFTVFYEGQEIDRFSTYLGALTLDFRPSDKLSLKLTTSGFSTSEAITYDILGLYRIDLLDNTTGSETADDSILNLGYGGNLIHARNYIDAVIFNLSHKGSHTGNQNSLNWGLTLQTENFNDKLHEWEMVDSAGYSVPFSDQELLLYYSATAHNKLMATRFSGYLQDVAGFSAGSAKFYLNGGIRFNYLSTNRQLVISPRTRLTILPPWSDQLSFHVSAGWYHQPPFYKEMRDPSGRLHKDIKAQRSVHFVLGSSYDFPMWERPFKLTGELYYKKLDNLVPYVIDDVDIQYLPQYTARGYVTGIEFKLNGEFVKDAESWATLSFMKTREDRTGDDYGDYPRQTDQLVNFGLFFQDYFPNNPSYRVHANVYYGSRLPYSSPDYDNPEEYYHLKAYKRIDLGLSKSFVTDRNGNRRFVSKYIRDLYGSLEVFNLFGFNNQASYQWVRTVSNQEGLPNMFAIPNYLTGRLFNIRLTLKL